MHQLLAEQLEPGVDGADEVAPGFGQRIVTPVEVRTLDLAVGVDLLDLDPLFTAHDGLVSGFDACEPDIIAGLVIRVALEILGSDLGDEHQQIAADLAGITPDGAVDHIEPAEIALVETQLVLLGNVAGDESRRAGPHPGVGDFAVELGDGETENPAHAGGIEPALVELAVDDHQIVAFARLDQELAVAVEHLAARGILDDVAQDIGLGQLLVTRIEELQPREPPDQEDEDENHYPLQQTHAGETVDGPVHNRATNLAVKIRPSSQTAATVTDPEATIRSTVRTIWLHESASKEKKTAWWTATRTIR